MNKYTFGLVALMITGASTLAHANLLNNPGFEEQGERYEAARHWRMDDPDDHGDAWGTAIRTDWRAFDGYHSGAIRGAWAGMGEYGGFWQEVAIEVGVTYKASAWFWADQAWRAEVQELKIEFWNSDRTELLAEQVVPLEGVGESWTRKEVSLTAPQHAAWGRIVVNAHNVGSNGSLQLDQVALEAVR